MATGYEFDKDENLSDKNLGADNWSSSSKRSVPRLSECEYCNTIGLYEEECESCGGENMKLYKKPSREDVAEEFSTYGECHRCDEIGYFASKCTCGGLFLIEIKKDNKMIGTRC